MSRRTQGPPTPDPERLAELIDFVSGFKMGRSEEEDDQLQEVVEALDWAIEEVNKRRGYSKKYQLKSAAVNRILAERLGEEMTAVKAQAAEVAEQQIFEEVADGAVEPDDVEFARGE